MKKRIVSILTALALCLSLCPGWAFAAEGESPTDAVAEATKKDGTTATIANVDELVAAFNTRDYDGATFKLLKDVEILNSSADPPAVAITITIECILNLNECCITSDCAEGTIQVSTTYSTDNVTIQGTGTVANTGGGPALKIDGGYAILKGGTYSATQGDTIISSSLYLGDLLGNQEDSDPWNAYYLGSSDTPITGILENTTLSGTVTVGPCTHVYSDTFVTDGENSRTHSKPCLACGHRSQKAECKFDWEPVPDSQWHDGTCSVCKADVREDHEYGELEADGKHTCKKCLYEEFIVAKVETADGGTKYYASVTDAITGAANNGGTVTVVADTTVGDLSETNPVNLTVAENVNLTLSSRSTLSVSNLTNNGSIVNNGTIDLPSTSALTNNGSINNNGTVTLPKDGTDADAIRGMNLEGTGTVRVGNGTADTVYDNKGNQMIGDLDFSKNPLPTGDSFTWDSTKKILTLTNAVIGGTVTLPDTDVTIVTNGTCSINKLSAVLNSSGLPNPQDTHLTFTGSGKLTVQERIALTNGDGNTLTVAEGATVVAEKGIEGGSSGNVNFPVTVNGTLTAMSADDDAIRAGKVVVRGPNGKLYVSGKEGVFLGGMNPAGSAPDFTGVFTVEKGGTFYADCTDYNVRVSHPSGKFPDSSNPDKAISLPNPEAYLPTDCEVKTTEQEVSFVKKSTGLVYTGPMAIHENHDYTGAWKCDDDTSHSRECSFEGCNKRGPKSAHEYDSSTDLTCNLCGYTRTRPDPPDPPTPPVHYHSWSTWITDDAEHWIRCTTCGAIKDRAAHIYDDDRDAVCNVCGYERTPLHVHVWAEDWSSDSAHHWHACTAEGCDLTDSSQMDGYGEHTYDDDRDAVCNVCGYERTLPHVHVWAEDWSSDSAHHWHACTAEGCDLTDSSQMDGYGAHSFENAWDSDCQTCGYRRILPRPSGGGSGGGIRAYAITVEKSEHGKVTPNRTYAASGTAITLTVTPDPGYALLDLTAVNSRGDGITLADNSFTMPAGDVTVKASFAPVPEENTPNSENTGTLPPQESTCDGGAACPSGAYADLDTGSWYHEAVDYAVRAGLLTGFVDGTFRPGSPLTRAQLAQILYNMEGKPAVTGGSAFADVAPDSWCAGAVAWAAARGIITGYGNGRFGPSDSITREQLAVMLWRYAGSPSAADRTLPFTDGAQAGSWALEALCWAVENGILSGKGSGVLDPAGLTSRAEAAQMLWNLANK